ncbi:methyltransferase domain-containing protein [Nakamurella flava]|uniref:Methyltransferase domain-containing protein n=1 Tax=Nakamurella flava TaxID=2576308 RepID=A0A4U6QPA0_9ACTN|nr:methyltransferase domain-containing protein [Nakamurella flava]
MPDPARPQPRPWRPRRTGRTTPRTVAGLVELVTAGPLPVRITAFDGSATGPEDSPVGLHVADRRALTYLLGAPGDLGLARAYVAGHLQPVGVTHGNPYPLLRALAEGLRLRRPALADLPDAVRALGLGTLRPIAPPPEEAPARWRRVAEGLRHSHRRDAAAISRHYDVSNTFYEYVLGPSMTYTCAVYTEPPAEVPAALTAAQEAKHALVFDKLGLQPGQRLLDVGCGWGAMVRHAARRGVRALGVTLSREQAEWARAAIVRDGLQDLAEVRYCDYRDVPEGGFDAVSSIGLSEHVGVANYPSYFTALHERVRPGGRLLNHSITRPTNDSDVRTEPFIDRYVFPDGELTGSGRMIVAMQDAGWDVRHSENLREHYALTLQGWCANLETHWDACVAEVGVGKARVWGLYMAACAVSFERDQIQLHQVLAVRPRDDGSADVPLRPWWTG